MTGSLKSYNIKLPPILENFTWYIFQLAHFSSAKATMSTLTTACDKVRAGVALDATETQALSQAALERADEMEKEKAVSLGFPPCRFQYNSWSPCVNSVLRNHENIWLAVDLKDAAAAASADPPAPRSVDKQANKVIHAWINTHSQPRVVQSFPSPLHIEVLLTACRRREIRRVELR